MTEALQTLEAPITPPLSGYHAVEEKLAALEQADDDIVQMLQAHLEELDPPTKEHVEAVSDSYSDKWSAATVSGESLVSLSDYMAQAGGVPDKIVHTIIEREAIDEEAKAAEKELETYAPEKADDVLESTRILEARIDYDQIADAMYGANKEPQLPYNVGFVIGARRLLEAGHAFTYDELKSIEYHITEFTTQWEGEGLLVENDADTEYVESGESQHPDDLVLEEIPSLQAALTDAQEIHTAYRRFDHGFHYRPNTLIRELDEYKNLPGEKDMPDPKTLLWVRDIHYNDAFKAAVGRSLKKAVSELPTVDFGMDMESEAYQKFVEEARKIDADAALREMQVTGQLESLPFDLTENELKGILKYTIPPIALVNIKRLEFRPLTPEENPDGDTTAINNIDAETGEAKIIIDSSSVLRQFAILDQEESLADISREDLRQISKDNMLVTLTHEFGHSLHFALPAAALKQWHEVTETDPTPVTNYVKNMHDEGHSHKDWEDFADSMGIFVTKPNVLRVISNARFHAMREIYQAFMPNYAENLLVDQAIAILSRVAMQATGGASDEEIRRVYLAHVDEDGPAAPVVEKK